MTLTRDHKQTVLARIKRDPEFAARIYEDALDHLKNGETAKASPLIRDLWVKGARPPERFRARKFTRLLHHLCKARGHCRPLTMSPRSSEVYGRWRKT